VTDLETLRGNLEHGTGFPFALYAWRDTPKANAWGTVNLVAEVASIWADDRQEEQALTGQVHLFTQHPMDFLTVQRILAAQDFYWRLDGAQYEQDTRLLHYTWIWSDWRDLL